MDHRLSIQIVGNTQLQLCPELVVVHFIEAFEDRCSHLEFADASKFVHDIGDEDTNDRVVNRDAWYSAHTLVTQQIVAADSDAVDMRSVAAQRLEQIVPEYTIRCVLMLDDGQEAELILPVDDRVRVLPESLGIRLGDDEA